VSISVQYAYHPLHLSADANLQFALKVILALLAILLASAICGRLAIAVRQPRVLGEMVAGVLLGPTLLGAVAPSAERVLFPSSIRPTLYVLSTIGLTLYMFLVGVGFSRESPHQKDVGRRVGLVAMSGILPTVTLGAIAGFIFYRQMSPADVSRPIFALFVGGAVSVTAFPMLARILYEKNLENTRIGQLLLLAASVDDAVAWCFLAVLVALNAGRGWVMAVRTLVLGVAFTVVMLFILARLLRPLGDRVARDGTLRSEQMYIIALVVLGAGWFTDWIGIYSVFGGFIAGLAMPRNPGFREVVHHRMMDFVCTFLLPVFFVLSGLNTRLAGFTQPSILLIFTGLLLVGFLGKYIGCAFGARIAGLGWRPSWAIGALMNARGLMILIFINIGLAQGMISQKLFSLLVLVAVVTTAAAAPLYRRALPPHLEAGIRSSTNVAGDLPGPLPNAMESEVIMARKTLDYLIIGAGPSGLQMAYLLQQAGRDYQVVEANSAPGSFFTVYPRHRSMISINKRHTGSEDPEFNLRVDWNSLLSNDPDFRFTGYSGKYFPDADDMVRYLGDYAAKHDLSIEYNQRVTCISGYDGAFSVTTEAGCSYSARRVIVATGVSKTNIPDIPGIELAEHYATVSVAPEDFTNKRVLIVGKGNSAMETANNLLGTAAEIHVIGPRPLQLAWKTHFVGHVRSINSNFIDSYQLKSQNAVLDARLLGLEKSEEGYKARIGFTVRTVVREYDFVIACTGFRLDETIFDSSCRPELAIDGRFPKLSGAYESVNVPGLYFIGTLTQQLDFKRSTNGFIHGFRYGVRALSRILEQRYAGVSWPYRKVAVSADDFTRIFTDRTSRSSGLFQQFGNLADLLVISSEGEARYYEEVPVGYLANPSFGVSGEAYSLTLEYGPDHDKLDPLVPRLSSSVTGGRHVDALLHPVVRHYRGGELAETLHLPDDLDNQWNRPDVHMRLLSEYFREAIGVDSHIDNHDRARRFM
jgi:Kef-type K+ transport system membrane component KefB/thioredoxin reductase